MIDEPYRKLIDAMVSEPESVYHAKKSEYLSSHQLADFRKCPLLYRKKASGLVDDEDMASYLVGRAAHVRILEGRDVFDSTFAVGGPINPKTGKPFGKSTKAFIEWAEVQGRPVLSQDQANLVEQMADGVAMNNEAVDLLLYGRSEGVVRVEYCGTPCQIRIDWLHPHHGIVDIKTCDDLTWFEADVRRFGYAHQMAFYRAVAKVVCGVDVPVHIVAVERKEPFRCGVWRFHDDALVSAQRENEATIRRLLVCRKTGEWPTEQTGTSVSSSIGNKR